MASVMMFDQEAKLHEELQRSERLFDLLILVVTLASILACIIIASYITRKISYSIKTSTEKARLISEGSLSEDFEERLLTRTNEIGKLAIALQRIIEHFREFSIKMKEITNGLSTASGEMSATADSMSQKAYQQAASIEQISTSMEEMVSNIEQNTESARQAEKISQIAKEGIDKVHVASTKSIEAINLINSRITIINDIAFQTNLLALNAAVEAARAGAHGKGFSVVAAEVRKLAERSRDAADEISQISKSSVSATKESSELLESLIPEVEKTARLVQEIASGSLEQQMGAEQVNGAIQTLNQVTQDMATTAEELSGTAQILDKEAQELVKLVAFFKD